MRKILVLLLILSGLAAGSLLLHHWSPAAVSGNECVDIPASPDYLSTDSEPDAIAAINHAHAQEDLPPLHLPANFYHLDPAQQQFILLNLERTERGLPPLEMVPALSQMALGYSRQLSNLHFFSHTSPISGTFAERMQSNPATANLYIEAGENLAANPVAGAGPIYEYMYDDASEACGHRMNILDPTFNLVGINWVRDSQYGSISVQEFLASPGWNLYSHPPPDAIPPSVTMERPVLKGSILTCQVLASDNVGVVRITWFLDHIGNQPYPGPMFRLDISHLSPGSHTLLVYVTDGALNYNMASYTFTVKP